MEPPDVRGASEQLALALERLDPLGRQLGRPLRLLCAMMSKDNAAKAIEDGATKSY